MESLLESKKFMKFLLVTAIGLFVLIIIVAIIFANFLLAKYDSKSINQQALGRMKIIGQASLIYAADADDHLPLANSWMDAITPFTPTNSHPFHSVALQQTTNVKTLYGEAFLAILSSSELTAIDPKEQPMVFDSTLLQRNAFGTLSTLPNPGRYEVNGKKSNLITYADGHVGWIDNQSSLKPFPAIKGRP